MGRSRILVLQHLSLDGPAYFATWCMRQGLVLDVRNTQAGDAYPGSMADHAALAVLGGEMSANDSLPSLRQAEALILEAVALGRPVVGHCLGGQLMARALGAAIGPSPAPEVGWHRLQPGDDRAAAVDWLGDPAGWPEVFQWHGESFQIPAGAVRLAGNAACPNQAFALGPHLGMQFHVEVDAAKLQAWASAAPARDEAGPPQQPSTVQAPSVWRQRLDDRLAAQQAWADRLYARWWRTAGRG